MVCSKHVDSQIVQFFVEISIFFVNLFGNRFVNPNGYNLTAVVHLLYEFRGQGVQLGMAAIALLEHFLLWGGWMVPVKVLKIDDGNLAFWSLHLGDVILV